MCGGCTHIVFIFVRNKYVLCMQCNATRYIHIMLYNILNFYVVELKEKSKIMQIRIYFWLICGILYLGVLEYVPAWSLSKT